MRLVLTFQERYMPRRMLFHIRSYYASLKPWMCDGSLVGHLLSVLTCLLGSLICI